MTVMLCGVSPFACSDSVATTHNHPIIGSLNELETEV